MCKGIPINFWVNISGTDPLVLTTQVLMPCPGFSSLDLPLFFLTELCCSIFKSNFCIPSHVTTVSVVWFMSYRWPELWAGRMLFLMQPFGFSHAFLFFAQFHHHRFKLNWKNVHFNWFPKRYRKPWPFIIALYNGLDYTGPPGLQGCDAGRCFSPARLQKEPGGRAGAAHVWSCGARCRRGSGCWSRGTVLEA